MFQVHHPFNRLYFQKVLELVAGAKQQDPPGNRELDGETGGVKAV